MRPLLVVTLEPFLSDLPDLLQRLEYVRIEDFRAIGAIESLINLELSTGQIIYDFN